MLCPVCCQGGADAGSNMHRWQSMLYWLGLLRVKGLGAGDRRAHQNRNHAICVLWHLRATVQSRRKMAGMATITDNGQVIKQCKGAALAIVHVGSGSRYSLTLVCAKWQECTLLSSEQQSPEYTNTSAEDKVQDALCQQYTLRTTHQTVTWQFVLASR